MSTVRTILRISGMAILSKWKTRRFVKISNTTKRFFTRNFHPRLIFWREPFFNGRHGLYKWKANNRPTRRKWNNRKITAVRYKKKYNDDNYRVIVFIARCSCRLADVPYEVGPWYTLDNNRKTPCPFPEQSEKKVRLFETKKKTRKVKHAVIGGTTMKTIFKWNVSRYIIVITGATSTKRLKRLMFPPPPPPLPPPPLGVTFSSFMVIKYPPATINRNVNNIFKYSSTRWSRTSMASVRQQ